MICPSCSSNRAYEVHNYDNDYDGWVCSECGDGDVGEGGKPVNEGHHQICRDCRISDQDLLNCQIATEHARKTGYIIPRCNENNCYYFKRCMKLKEE